MKSIDISPKEVLEAIKIIRTVLKFIMESKWKTDL